jgi:hypothetical protein
MFWSRGDIDLLTSGIELADSLKQFYRYLVNCMTWSRALFIDLLILNIARLRKS